MIMDQSCGNNVGSESEPEDGEILDEVEGEEQGTPSPERRGHSRRGSHRQDRKHHDQVHDDRRRNHQKYNNRSERSGGISRTLEYVRYLKSFNARNKSKSTSARRSSVPERRNPERNRRSRSRSPEYNRRSRSRSPEYNRRSRSRSPEYNRRSRSRSPDVSPKSISRSPSPRRSDKNNYNRRSRREIKSHLERNERKSKSSSSSSIVSREENFQEDVNDASPNNVRNIDVEDVSADEMPATMPSPVSVSSIEVVPVPKVIKIPEIITLDSTDTSDEETAKIPETAKTTPQMTADDVLLINANNPTDFSDLIDPEVVGDKTVMETPTSIHLTHHSDLIEENRDEFIHVTENPSDIQTLVGTGSDMEEKMPDGCTVEEVELDENIMDGEFADDFTVEVVILNGNVPGEDVDRTNVDDMSDENVIEDDPMLDRNIILGEVLDPEGEELENNHMSDEELDVLELRNKLLADLVNKADSLEPPSPSFSLPEKLPETEATEDRLGEENINRPEKIDGGNNDEEEQEALRAVLLSLYQSTNKKSKPAEPLCDNNVNNVPKSAAIDSRPKPIAKRRSTDDERRSIINSRRTSNTTPSSKSRPRSPPPKRKPLPVHRRSSVESRRYSRDYDRRRSRSRSRGRERGRKSPIRDRARDGDNRKPSRSATLSPPLSNKPREFASSSTPVVKQTLNTSQSSGHENNASIVNVKELSRSDLRVQLLKNSGLLKKASIGLTSPNSDPVAPANTLFQHNQSQIGTDAPELTIRRTVNFADNGNDNMIALCPARIWDHPITTTISSNLSLPQVRHEVPSLLQNTYPSIPSLLSATSQPLQRTVLLAAPAPVFPQYIQQAHNLSLEHPLAQQQQFQSTRIGLPSLMSACVNVLNPRVSLTEIPNFQNTVTKSTGNPLKQIRRRGRRKPRPKKALPLTNRWDKPPSDNVEANEVAVNTPILNANPCIPSTSTCPLKGTAKPNIVRSISVAKPKSIMPTPPQLGSPLLKTAVVNQANNIKVKTTPVVTLGQLGSAKPLQKSSPYASPVLSPAANTATALPKPTNRHLIVQTTFSDAYAGHTTKRKQSFKRLIIPVRDDDSTDDERDVDVRNENLDGVSTTAGLEQPVGIDFRKSLDEFLKRARDESERKAKEKLVQGNTENNTPVDVPSPSPPSSLSSVHVVNESTTAASEFQTTDHVNPSLTNQSSEKINWDVSVPKLFSSEDTTKEILSTPGPSPTVDSKSSPLPTVDTNSAAASTVDTSSAPTLTIDTNSAAASTMDTSFATAPTDTVNSPDAATSNASCSSASAVEHPGPSPIKKRKILKANLKNKNATPGPTSEAAGSEANVSEAPVDPTSNLSSNKTVTTSVITTATNQNNQMLKDKINQQPKPQKELNEGSRPISTTIPKTPNVAAASAPKSANNVNINATKRKQTSPLELTQRSSPIKDSAPGAGNIAARIAPRQPSPPSSKKVIDDLTRKVIGQRDQLALASKEKELLHCRQSCVDGLRDISKGLQQHTRLYMEDSKLQLEITAAKKRLMELNKKQLDIRAKASSINMTVKEKSKLLLPIKANCITLEREVKKLGDKVQTNFYKVTDLFTRDIDAVVKDIRTLHSRQPTNLKLERGVTFQVIISELDPTSTLTRRNINVTSAQNQCLSPEPLPLVAAKVPAKPKRNVEEKTNKSVPGAAVSIISTSSTGKETSSNDDNPSGQQTSRSKITVPKDKVTNMSSHSEIRFLTRHGRGSLTEEENTEESLSQTDRLDDVTGLEVGDVLTDIKSSGTAVQKLADMEIPILIQAGAFTIRLDPHVQLCVESLLKNVCLIPGCEFQHI